MLSEKGHSVTVFISDKSVKSIQVEKLAEARVIRFNPSQTNAYSFLGDVTSISYEFANILKLFIEKEGKPDYIESQDYQGIGYFLLQFKACLFDWCKNIPVIITLHSPSFLYMEYNQLPLYKNPNFWIGEMERFCIQAADLVISPSDYLVKELKERFKINNPNLKVIANPFSFELDEKETAVLNASILNNDLTFYGKLSPQKGTFKILEQFQMLWEKGFDKPFTMVGDQSIVFHPLGKTMGTIIRKQYAKYIKSGMLKFKNKIAPSERVKLLSSSVIFIIPSIVDNLPYAVLEMMSQGKILIVSKQGGQAEIIFNNEDGFVFDYNDPTSFETTLNKVIQLTKEERINVSQKAIKKIGSDYSYDKIYSLKIKWIENIDAGGIKQIPHFPYIRILPVKAIEKNVAQKVSGMLSVIVPYYNLGSYLDETIVSILSSTFKHIEVFIINDGSTEAHSLGKLDHYRNHTTVKVIDKKNTGLADTRNVGAELANGEFLAFLDADDTVVAEYYEKAIRILTQYQNVHFVGAWTQYFGGSKNIWPTFNPEPPLLLTHNSINSSSLVYKTGAFLLAGKNDSNFKIGLEDYESVIHLKANGLNGVAIPEILFNYRVRKNSMIKNSSSAVRADYHNKIAAKHKNLFSDFSEEIKQLNKSNGLPLTFDNSTLDDLPFQHIPFMRPLVRKLILVVKANPRLKNATLLLKNILGKQ
jgi:glycosyltransferase involved in cell wall biosynthesis